MRFDEWYCVMLRAPYFTPCHGHSQSKDAKWRKNEIIFSVLSPFFLFTFVFYFKCRPFFQFLICFLRPRARAQVEVALLHILCITRRHTNCIYSFESGKNRDEIKNEKKNSVLSFICFAAAASFHRASHSLVRAPFNVKWQGISCI